MRHAGRASRAARRCVSVPQAGAAAPASGPAPRPAPRLDFRDAEAAYRHCSTPELLRALAVLRLCAVPAVVRHSGALMALGRPLGLVRPFFDQFCAGEDEEEAVRMAARLHEAAGIGAILDYVAEGAAGESPAEFDRNAEVLLKSVGAAARLGQAFSAVKLSALCGVGDLEAASAALMGGARGTSPPPAADAQGLEARLAGALAGTPGGEEVAARVAAAYRRLARVADAARDSGVRLLLDAEQSWLQPAIVALTREAMREYNRGGLDLVYHTQQAYLVSAVDDLGAELRMAREGGYRLAVKLVRGAYMSERDRAARLGLPDPIWPTKDATDRAYDECVRMVLDDDDGAALMVASHNEASVERAVAETERRGADRSRVSFATLHGMAGHVSSTVARNGFATYKYLPFGRQDEAVAYLQRRAEENSTVLSGGATAAESALLREELLRRARR